MASAVSLAIGVLALLFTIASFWWLNARRGRLRCAAPHAYGMAATPQVFLLRLPLALYNTGARAIVVRDLRCWFPESRQVLPLPWRTTRRTLRPESGDVEDFPTPFPVRGREAVPVIPEFGGPFPGFTLDAGSHRCLVEILENDRDSWRVLLDFELHVTGDTEKRKAYLAYSNLAEDPRAKERGEAAARDLMAKLKQIRPPPGP
jgi:hypothetical protein